MVAEICVPLRAGDRVVGVINADSPTKLGEDTRWEIERCADLLARRIEELGGPEASVNPAQRLARAVARLAALEDPEDLVRETARSALELAGFESAMLALADGHGSLYVHHAEGPFAVAFADLPAEDLDAIGEWVTHGTSSYTVNEAAGRGFAGHEPLRRAGAASLIVLPLAAGGERLGIIVLADRTPHRLSTEHVELLELLAFQAASGLRMAAAVLELRERAARDPLTGLGHHAAFYEALPVLRESERRCALLVADVDGFKSLNDTRGHAAGDDALRAMAALLRAASPTGGRAFRIGGDEFALVFECDGEADAERVGWELRSQAPDRIGSTLSVGLALAEAGETDEAVVARADAALYEVKRRGRDAVRVAAPRSLNARASTVTRSRPPLADLAVDVDLAPVREVDLHHVAALVRHVALLRDRAPAQAPGAAGEARARARGQDHDVEHAVVGIGLGHAGAAAEGAADRDDHLPGMVVEHRPPVGAHGDRQRPLAGRGAQRADAVGQRAEARLERLGVARGHRRQARAGDVDERAAVGQPAELERPRVASPSTASAAASRGSAGSAVGAREVVRRAGREHGQRHVEPARQLGHRADRPVAAGHRQAVRVPGRGPLELVALAAEHGDLGAARPHRGRQRLGVEPAAGCAVGGEGDAHGR